MPKRGGGAVSAAGCGAATERSARLDWLWIGLLGVFCTGVAHSLFVASLAVIKARTAAVVFAMEPVYGITVAWLLFDENPTLRMLLGGALIIVAIVVSGADVRRRRQENRRRRGRVSLSAVVVAEVAVRIDLVANPLLEHLGLGKTAVGLALPDLHAVTGDVKHPAGARHQRHFAEVVAEGAEQFLRQPRGAQQPLALGAIGDDNFCFCDSHVR